MSLTCILAYQKLIMQPNARCAFLQLLRITPTTMSYNSTVALVQKYSSSNNTHWNYPVRLKNTIWKIPKINYYYCLTEEISNFQCRCDSLSNGIFNYSNSLYTTSPLLVKRYKMAPLQVCCALHTSASLPFLLSPQHFGKKKTKRARVRKARKFYILMKKNIFFYWLTL